MKLTKKQREALELLLPEGRIGFSRSHNRISIYGPDSDTKREGVVHGKTMRFLQEKGLVTRDKNSNFVITIVGKETLGAHEDGYCASR